jgi:hypothetical protein
MLFCKYIWRIKPLFISTKHFSMEVWFIHTKKYMHFLWIMSLRPFICTYELSPHDGNRSSDPRPVGPVIFFSFYLKLYKTKFKNSIWTSNSNCHFEDLQKWSYIFIYVYFTHPHSFFWNCIYIILISGVYLWNLMNNEFLMTILFFSKWNISTYTKGQMKYKK